MNRQMLLPLAVNDQDVLQRLWEQIPEECRIELAVQFARLIAQAARDTSPPQQEPSREVRDQEFTR